MSSPAASFNCAAPFRKRLSEQSLIGCRHQQPASIVPPPFGSGYGFPAGAPRRLLAALQLCRPLSEAVMLLSGLLLYRSIRLQLCRPLSEAVIRTPKGGSSRHFGASIVPPPFGSGYAQMQGSRIIGTVGFNCAAPFRKRLSRSGRSSAGKSWRFNCAAPFRKRL